MDTRDTGNTHLATLFEYSKAASAAATLGEVLDLTTKAATDGLGYDQAAVLLSDGESEANPPTRLAANLSRGDSSSSIDDFAAAIALCWSEILQERQLDPRRDSACMAPTRVHVEKLPDTRQLVVPLDSPAGLVGALVVVQVPGAHSPTDTDKLTLLEFSRLAAGAIVAVREMEELRGSEERLRSLVTSLTETLYSVRIGRGIVIPSFYSPQLETLTGFTPEEALATPEFWRSVTHPDDRLKVEDAKEELIKGRAVALEYRIRRRDGEVRWVLDTPVPVETSQGRYVRINGTILDITDRKNLEDRLRRAQRMETVGTLAGGVAHNFNNYLQMVVLQIDDAESMTGATHPAFARLQQALETLRLAGSLAEQLMAFSRKIEGAREEVSLDDIIVRTLPLIEPILGRTIRVEHHPDSDTDRVCADSSQIQQAVINLCINARDAMPAGGTVTIRTQNVMIREHDRERLPHSRPGEYVRLQVHDTGFGMDAATQERIFEPFFTTKGIGRGTGLGLAVTYMIVTDHGGWIDVDSRPESGTLFSIYLPSAALDRGTGEAFIPSKSERLILIVDSIETEREHLASLLESLGATVLTAEGVADALAVLWDVGEQLDSVICTLDLPSVDVQQIAKQVSDSRGTKMVVGGTRQQIRSWSPYFSSGNARTLEKPYNTESLARVLDTAIPDNRAT